MVDSISDFLGKDKQRLDRTEEQLGTTDVSNYFEIPFIVVDTFFADIRNTQQQITGSDLIWGHEDGVIPSQGVWGSFLWSDTFTGSTQRTLESAIIFELDEFFTSTTYEDSGSTTASGWGTGSILFSAGSVLQTINLGSDVGLSTTKFDRVTYEAFGSFTHLLQGSFSSDGGVNWTGVNPNIENVIGSDVTGSEILFKGVDSTGSVELTRMKFTIKQDDY